MFLNRIILQDFKNIASADLEFSPKINCISGSNGAGKTNLLDAVYYLSMTKSFFSASDQYVYSYDSPEAVMCGFYQMDDGAQEKVAASVRRNGEKVIKRGAKAYSRFSDHVGLLPVVMVSPLDSALVNDSGEERRKYLNFILSQTDRDYLRHIQAYSQLLMQRNKLLKSDFFQQDLLETIDFRMAPHADYIFNARRSLCEQIRPLVCEFYGRLSREGENVDIAYKSDLLDFPFDVLLHNEVEKDRVMRYTTVGVQRDDVSFLLDGRPLRRCGSQGQQKSFLLALKLAQYAIIRQTYGRTPILLLDDVFDKLDINRVEELLSLVSSLDFGQIFITDCNKVRLEGVAERIGAECRFFYVDDGEVSSAQ